MNALRRGTFVGAVMALAAGGASLPAWGALPTIASPSLIGPVNSRNVDVPVLFLWTPISPAQTFNIGLQSRTAKSGTAAVAVSYELQISDRQDFSSRVLYDTVVDATTFLFVNQPQDPGFTAQQTPNTALFGGQYYWRVRALFAGAASNFSPIGVFFIRTPGTATALHSLGVTSIALSGVARRDSTIPVLVEVRNLGNFAESGARLEIDANGAPIGTLDVPELAPGKSVQVSTLWTPENEGIAQLAATLQYSDDNGQAHHISTTAVVTAATARRTKMYGRLVESFGSYSLQDAAGNTIATLTQARAAANAFGAYVGSLVEVEGNLSVAQGDFVMQVINIRKLPNAT